MIFRRTLPLAGDKRTLTRRAWLPRAFDYEGERVWIWGERYCVEQRFYTAFGPGSDVMCSRHAGNMATKGDHWCETRRLTLADACLEKLNPKPVPPPVPVQPTLAQLMQQYGVQSTLPQFGALGGMPPQGLGQQFQGGNPFAPRKVGP